MKKVLGITAGMAFALFTVPALAQDQRPAPSVAECIDAHPELCRELAKRAAKRPAKRRPSGPHARITGIDIEYRNMTDNTNARLDSMDGRLNKLADGQAEIRDLLNRPAPNTDDHDASAGTPEERQINVHVQMPDPPDDPVFAVDLGGLISVRNSRAEVSPGGRLGARFRVGRFQLGLQSSYERVEYDDASTIEDVVVEPVARYETLAGELRPYFQLSMGYWTERIVWQTLTSCGQSTCPAGERNTSFTASAAFGVEIYPLRNVSISAEPLAIRWVPDAEGNHPMWSFVPSASVALHIP